MDCIYRLVSRECRGGAGPAAAHPFLAHGHTVDQVMSRSCVMASADLNLQELVDRYILDQGQRCLVLMRADQPAGLLTLHNIRQVPRERWGSTTMASKS